MFTVVGKPFSDWVNEGIKAGNDQLAENRVYGRHKGLPWPSHLSVDICDGYNGGRFLQRPRILTIAGEDSYNSGEEFPLLRCIRLLKKCSK